MALLFLWMVENQNPYFDDFENFSNSLKKEDSSLLGLNIFILLSLSKLIKSDG